MPTLDNFSLGYYSLLVPPDVSRYATGTYTITSSTKGFLRDSGSSNTYRYVFVTGIPFRPKKIFIRTTGTNLARSMGVTYDAAAINGVPSSNGAQYNLASLNGGDNNTMIVIRVYEYTDDITTTTTSSNALLGKGSFLLPISASPGEIVVWEAFG